MSGGQIAPANRGWEGPRNRNGNKEGDMSQTPEPRSVEPKEITRIDETAGPTPAHEHLVHGEQVTESSAGVEQREHVVTGEAGIEHRERIVQDTGADQQINRLRVSQLIWLFFG